MKLAKRFIVEPGKNTHLSKRDPGETLGIKKADAEKDTERHTEQLRELQDVLYADKRYALLVVPSIPMLRFENRSTSRLKTTYS